MLAASQILLGGWVNDNGRWFGAFGVALALLMFGQVLGTSGSPEPSSPRLPRMARRLETRRGLALHRRRARLRSGGGVERKPQRITAARQVPNPRQCCNLSCSLTNARSNRKRRGGRRTDGQSAKVTCPSRASAFGTTGVSEQVPVTSLCVPRSSSVPIPDLPRTRSIQRGSTKKKTESPR